MVQVFRIRCGQAQKRGKRGRWSELTNDVSVFAKCNDIS